MFDRPGGTIVTIYAGDDDTAPSYVIQKELACFYCPVFKAAFNSSFQEGQSQTYFLGETSKVAVRLLVNWLYNQAVLSFQLGQREAFENEDAKGEDMALVDL